MSKEGVNQAMIFTADTDVVVIATSVFSELSLIELLIEFGKNCKRKIYTNSPNCGIIWS